jgi:hypothetical protein
MTELKKAARVERIAAPDKTLALGSWWWATTERYVDRNYTKRVERRWLGCVTEIGSNYGELTDPETGDRYSGPYSVRIHFDNWDATCEPEPDAAAILRRRVEQHQGETLRLMDEVRALTARLGVASAAPSGGGETAAIAVRGSSAPMDAYRKDLALAQETTLPKLFEEIRESNERTARAMKASLLPFEAMVGVLEPTIDLVKRRIFSVELYAGLAETIEQIADGAPAADGEPIRIFQRRHYMDEECLANYRAGGMRFEQLEQFDAWLAEPANRDRILPFPRSVVAFKVRRNDVPHRDWREYVALSFGSYEDRDKWTFLYFRNGDRVYRLRTAIEFDEQLFPDLEHSDRDLSRGKLYAKRAGGEIKTVVSEHRYRGIVEAERAKNREIARKERAAKAARARGDKNAPPPGPWFWRETGAKDYFEWTPDSVYYDDVLEFVERQIERHNRVVLVMQGLLDRSPVFHPHPEWKLWTPDGFAAAVRLVYDEARALSPGAAPDFEAYRARLNASIRVGTTTVGQQVAWEEAMAERENARLGSYSRIHHDRFKPYGDPGPGEIAVVRHFGPSGATFRWTRERRTYARRNWFRSADGGKPGDPMGRTFRCPTARLLNVDAYAPGDYRQFYADPRTRADYLVWAPLMLAAEDYKAGKRRRKGDD